jgi:hypothetical protein
LRLKGQSPADAQEIAQNLARQCTKNPQLHVNSQPAGAQLFIDDKSAGKTPFINSTTLSAGKHKLRLRFDDGLELEQNFHLVAGEHALIRVRHPDPVDKPDAQKSSIGSSIGWSLLASSVVSGLGAAALTGWLYLDQSRLDQEQTIGSDSVKSISRSDAKNLLVAMQYKTAAAIVTYGLSLTLATCSAVIFGVDDAQ